MINEILVKVEDEAELLKLKDVLTASHIDFVEWIELP